MALRQILLNKDRRDLDQKMAEIREEEEALEKEAAKIEEAIEEVESDEERSAIEEEVAAYEKKKKDLEEKKKAIEAEIAEIEEKLAEYEKDEEAEEEPEEEKPVERGAKAMGVKNNELEFEIRDGIFKGQSRAAVQGIVQREEVKEWIQGIRNAGETNREITGAGILIPEVLVTVLRDNLHRYSKLLPFVNVVNVKGKARVNMVGEIPEAIWTEACATLNQLSLRFNQTELDGYKVAGYIPVCNALLQDADIDLANEILDKIGQAIGYAIDKAILYGTDKKMPMGIVTRLALTQAPADVGANERPFVNLSTTNIQKVEGATVPEFMSKLVEVAGGAVSNYNASGHFWAMAPATKAKLLAKLISVNASGAIVTGLNNELPIIGGQIVELPFIPEGDIIGGYGKNYIFASRKEMWFDESRHVQFIEDNTVYKGVARADGAPIIPEAFVAFNISGGAVTTKMDFAPDEANKAETTGV